jgi:hypothetical protein
VVGSCEHSDVCSSSGTTELIVFINVNGVR